MRETCHVGCETVHVGCETVHVGRETGHVGRETIHGGRETSHCYHETLRHNRETHRHRHETRRHRRETLRHSRETRHHRGETSCHRRETRRGRYSRGCYEISAAVPEGAAARHAASVVEERAARAYAEADWRGGRRISRDCLGDEELLRHPALGRGQGVRAVRVPGNGRAAGLVHVEDGGRDHRPAVAGGLRARQLSAGRPSHRAPRDRRARPARAVQQDGGHDLTVTLGTFNTNGVFSYLVVVRFSISVVCIFIR